MKRVDVHLDARDSERGHVCLFSNRTLIGFTRILGLSRVVIRSRVAGLWAARCCLVAARARSAGQLATVWPEFPKPKDGMTCDARPRADKSPFVTFLVPALTVRGCAVDGPAAGDIGLIGAGGMTGRPVKTTAVCTR
jgi:hypothetical protein